MNAFPLYMMLSLIVPIVGLLVFIFAKMLFTKQVPESRHTPIDEMFGQSSVLFHEQKESKEEDDDQGDDKDRE